LDHTNSKAVFTVTSIVDGENSYVGFNNFKYGFFIRNSANETVQYATYPKAGEVIKTDDGNLPIETLDLLQADETYVLHVYVEDAGVFYDKRIDITTAIPTRPFFTVGNNNPGESSAVEERVYYNSWVWNSEKKEWEPPVAKPSPLSDNGCYKWIETDSQWIWIEFDGSYEDQVI
jgi:hypothetical protein